MTLPPAARPELTTTAVIRRSPRLSDPAAVPGEGVDAGVAAHYGDPMREQRLLVEGLAVVDLSHRDVITVGGPDRRSWLHSLTSQQLSDLPPRTSVESLLLSPKGHIEHDLHIVDDGELTWITVEPGSGPALVAWLDRMRFMLRVEVTDVSEAYAVIGEPHRCESAEGSRWPGWIRGPGRAQTRPCTDHPPARSTRALGGAGVSCWFRAPTWWRR